MKGGQKGQWGSKKARERLPNMPSSTISKGGSTPLLHYAMCQIGKGDARPLEKEQPQISNNMFHTRNRGGHETAVTKSVPSLNM